jgi:hypothetical protein
VGGLRREVEKLKKKSGSNRWDLRCPVCGWETTLYGDLTVDLLVLEWEAAEYDVETDKVTYNKEANLESYDPNLLKLFWHEHHYNDFIEKRSGLPLSDPTISGISQAPTSLESLRRMEYE